MRAALGAACCLLPAAHALSGGAGLQLPALGREATPIVHALPHHRSASNVHPAGHARRMHVLNASMNVRLTPVLFAGASARRRGGRCDLWRRCRMHPRGRCRCAGARTFRSTWPSSTGSRTRAGTSTSSL